MFKEQVLITPFKTKNKENSELQKMFNVFQSEIHKIPKLAVREEFDEMKSALEDLTEIEKEWLRYI